MGFLSEAMLKQDYEKELEWRMAMNECGQRESLSVDGWPARRNVVSDAQPHVSRSNGGLQWQPDAIEVVAAVDSDAVNRPWPNSVAKADCSVGLLPMNETCSHKRDTGDLRCCA